MMTYKDKTWCSRSSSCRNKHCSRNYNDYERHLNERTVNLPLSQADLKADGCGYIPLNGETS